MEFIIKIDPSKPSRAVVEGSDGRTFVVESANINLNEERGFLRNLDLNFWFKRERSQK